MSQVVVVLLGLMGFQAETDIKNIEDCRPIKFAAARLACYDNFIDGKTYDAGVARQVAEDSFGRREMNAEKYPEGQLESAEASELEDVTLSKNGDEVLGLSTTIVSVEKGLRGRRTFTTDNGQVWQQQGTDRMSREKTPFEVVIKKGFGGTFSLVSKKHPKIIKVRRIK